jgi:hypothetical protein
MSHAGDGPAKQSFFVAQSSAFDAERISVFLQLRAKCESWGSGKHVTHNNCCATLREFAGAAPTFPREKVPQNLTELCDTVTDNFRVINPKDSRDLA